MQKDNEKQNPKTNDSVLVLIEGDGERIQAEISGEYHDLSIVMANLFVDNPIFMRVCQSALQSVEEYEMNKSSITK